MRSPRRRASPAWDDGWVARSSSRRRTAHAITSPIPGSVQGFTGHRCVVNNRESPSGDRCLAIHFDALPPGTTARATTGTFIDSLETARHFEGRGYGLMTSPTLSPGQTATANVQLAQAADDAVEASICIRVFDADDKLMTLRNPATTVDPGAPAELTWTIPELGGYPIAAVGIELVSAASSGTLYLDRLHWTGAPTSPCRRSRATCGTAPG